MLASLSQLVKRVRASPAEERVLLEAKVADADNLAVGAVVDVAVVDAADVLLVV